MVSVKQIKLGLVFIYLIVSMGSRAQEADNPVYDSYNDTLLIIQKKIITQSKLLMPREELLQVDSLKVNQRGLTLVGFTMNAITLGNEVSLKSSSAIITAEMKNEIINGTIKYKFIYIKDIILQAKDGRKVLPTTKSLKITFTN